MTKPILGHFVTPKVILAMAYLSGKPERVASSIPKKRCKKEK